MVQPDETYYIIDMICWRGYSSRLTTPYVKDGLSFYNKHAHYQAGITPLALVWKHRACSQYVIDTDSKGKNTKRAASCAGVARRWEANYF
jgi:hypothetical protein